MIVEGNMPQQRQEVERDYTGSPYVEMDLTDLDCVNKIGAYYIQLQSQQEHWYQGTAPYSPPWEKFPGSPGVQLKLLEMLVRQKGKLNFWDASSNFVNDDNTVTSYFEEGCERFISALNLEVKTA